VRALSRSTLSSFRLTFLAGGVLFLTFLTTSFVFLDLGLDSVTGVIFVMAFGGGGGGGGGGSIARFVGGKGMEPFELEELELERLLVGLGGGGRLLVSGSCSGWVCVSPSSISIQSWSHASFTVIRSLGLASSIRFTIWGGPYKCENEGPQTQC